MSAVSIEEAYMIKLCGGVAVGIAAITLIGCRSPDVGDNKINDRVKACSAGFSQETRASLHAQIDKASLAGDITPEIKEETRSIIFSQLAESDRLKGYEDYIACVEKDWNHDPQ